MRGLLTFLAHLAGSIVLGALIAYPAWLALQPAFDFPFHRVASRAMMFVLLVSVYFVFRRAGVADRRALGYGEARRQFLARWGLGVIAGIVVIAPLVASELLLGLRVVDAGARTVLDIVEIALGGLASGLVVALLEETYFRGAMYTAIERDSGPAAAVALSAATFAVLHFFGGKYLTRIDEPDWGSGLTIVADAAARFVVAPGGIVDSLLALFGVGLVLALVRLRTGSIAWCLGLHAGWVAAIAATKELSRLDPQASAAFLIGSYDGVIGWLALGWMLLLAPLLLSLRRAARGTEANS